MKDSTHLLKNYIKINSNPIFLLLNKRIYINYYIKTGLILILALKIQLILINIISLKANQQTNKTMVPHKLYETYKSSQTQITKTTRIPTTQNYVLNIRTQAINKIIA